MTELEAINKMLRAVGTQSVNSLISNHPQVPAAQEVLQDVIDREQADGFWFNQLFNKEYFPDTNGFIELPLSVIKIVPEDRNITLRGGKLFNRYLNTPVFETSVLVCKETHKLPWDELDSHAFKSYCAAIAAAEFIRNEIEDPTKEQRLLEEAQRHWVRLGKEQLEFLDLNIFDSPRVARARAGVRPYQINSTYRDKKYR